MTTQKIEIDIVEENGIIDIDATLKNARPQLNTINESRLNDQKTFGSAIDAVFDSNPGVKLVKNGLLTLALIELKFKATDDYNDLLARVENVFDAGVVSGKYKITAGPKPSCSKIG